jgi:PAS domain-containing protein
LLVKIIKHFHNKIIGAIEVNQDITEQKKIEQSLKQSLVQWEAVYEQPLFGVIQFNDDGVILRSNTKICELTDREAGELSGNTIELIFDDTTSRALRNALAAVSKNGLVAYKLDGAVTVNRQQTANGDAHIAVDIYLINDMRESGSKMNTAFIFTRQLAA